MLGVVTSCVSKGILAAFVCCVAISVLVAGLSAFVAFYVCPVTVRLFRVRLVVICLTVLICGCVPREFFLVAIVLASSRKVLHRTDW